MDLRTSIEIMALIWGGRSKSQPINTFLKNAFLNYDRLDASEFCKSSLHLVQQAKPAQSQLKIYNP